MSTIPFPQPQIVLDPKDPMATARIFAAKSHAIDGKYVLLHHADEWRSWTGSHYPITDEATVREQMWKFMEGALQPGPKGTTSPFTPNTSRVANALDALSAVCHLRRDETPPCWINTGRKQNLSRPEELIACANGLLHLPTRRLLDHDPRFFCVNANSFDYDPDAGCSEWLKFLDDLWEDEEPKLCLQEWFGYFLSTDTRQHKIFMLIGPPRGGKGTIGRVITRLLGSANVCSPTLSSLGMNFGPWQLVDKQVAIIADARLSGRQDQHIIAERLLSISGEDLQTLDRKYKEPWTGRLGVRFLILTNELPRIADASVALPSRFIILPLSKTWLGQEDHGLTDRLYEEMPGILNWSLDGWDRLNERGYFVQPQAAAELIEELEDLSSPINAFIRDRCIVEPGATIACDDLFIAWKAWCEAHGRAHAGTTQTFGRDLRAAVAGLKVIQPRDPTTRKQERHYEGIRSSSDTR